MGKKLSKNSIAGNVGYNILYRLLSIIYPIISTGYAARILTPSGVGRFAIAQNNASYFLVLAMLGIQAYSIREISRVRFNKSQVDRLFSEILVINAGLTLVAIALFLVCVSFLDVFKSDFYLYLICGTMLYMNFINIDWYFQAVEDFRFIATRSVIIKIISLLLLILFVHNVSDIYYYALIVSFSACGHYILNVTYARNTVSFKIKGINIKRHFSSLFFLALCTVSTELYARLDITMLGIMKGVENVAFYTYAQRIVNMLVVFFVAVTAVFLPRLSFYYANDRIEFSRLTRFGVDLMVFVSIPACFGIVSVAYPMIITWLGSSYTDVAYCLMILAFIIPLKCIGDILCYQVMLCAGQEYILMISYAITVVLNCLLNVMLIPGYGVVGACIASLISELFVFVLVLIFARKYFSVSIDRHNVFVVFITSIIMMMIVLSVESVVDSDLMKLLLGVSTGFLFFVVANLLFNKEFFVDGLVNRFRNSHGTKL